MREGVLFGWPTAALTLIPVSSPDWAANQSFAPVLAWLLLRSLPCEVSCGVLFEQLQLRGVLAASFGAIGLPGDSVWRAAARVRMLLVYPGDPAETLASETFWADPDVRWLTGVNASAGETWFNKEQFEETVGWLQLPALLKSGARETVTGDPDGADSEPAVGLGVAAACENAEMAGYNLESYLESCRSQRSRLAVQGVSRLMA